MTAEAAPGLTETALTPLHRELGARMVPFAGFCMPLQYRSVAEEHRAVRERAGLFDISHMGELHLRGRGAAAFLDRMTVNDVAGLKPRQAQYSCMCRPDGGIVDDLVIYRLDGGEGGHLEGGFLVVVNASNVEKDLAWLEEHRPEGVVLEDRSDETALLSLQGPRAEAILAPLASVDLSRLRFYWKTDGAVAGIPAMVSRTGYTGEDGFEIYVDRASSVKLWRALTAAGEAEGLLPAGLGARDTLRLEMKYPLYGRDIDESANPVEAGLGWIVKLEKRDFIGREALRRIKAEGPRRRLVGFRLKERGFPRAGYPVLLDGSPAGEVRSGTVSPSLGEGIGTCYLPAGSGRVGTPIAIEIRGRRIPGEVASTPFYKGGSLKR